MPGGQHHRAWSVSANTCSAVHTHPFIAGPFYGATAFALGRFFLQRAVAQGDPDERRTESVFRAALNLV